jgi:hypothetical protein
METLSRYLMFAGIALFLIGGGIFLASMRKRAFRWVACPATSALKAQMARFIFRSQLRFWFR